MTELMNRTELPAELMTALCRLTDPIPRAMDDVVRLADGLAAYVRKELTIAKDAEGSDIGWWLEDLTCELSEAADDLAALLKGRGL